jgi:hypothetical protein
MKKVKRSPGRSFTGSILNIPALTNKQFIELKRVLSLKTTSDDLQSKINKALAVSYRIQRLSKENTFSEVSADLQQHLKDMRGVADFFDGTKKNKLVAKNFIEDCFAQMRNGKEFENFRSALIEYQTGLNRLLKDFKRPDKDGVSPKYYHSFLIRNLAAIAKVESVGDIKFIDAIFNILSEKDYKILGNSWKTLGEKAQDNGVEAKKGRLKRARKYKEIYECKKNP